MGGGADLKTARWADKHNQEEGMSTEVSVEAQSVCAGCAGDEGGLDQSTWSQR